MGKSLFELEFMETPKSHYFGFWSYSLYATAIYDLSCSLSTSIKERTVLYKNANQGYPSESQVSPNSQVPSTRISE